MLFSSFAQVVMAVVALLAFLTVVGVIWIGSQEQESVHETGESAAAAAWSNRAAQKEAALEQMQQAQGQAVPSADAVANTVEAEQTVSSGQATNQSVGDLSEDEKEAKRRAALERRAARAAQKADQG